MPYICEYCTVVEHHEIENHIILFPLYIVMKNSRIQYNTMLPNNIIVESCWPDTENSY
jgi:hypothetical protein